MTVLPFLFACNSALTVGDAEVDDFADDSAADTASTDDTGSSDTAGDSGEDTEEEPSTDFSAYTGERNFYANLYDVYVCDDTVTEVGTQLTSGELYDAMVTACPACGYFYENVPDVDAVCDGYLPLGNTYRAILLTDAGGIAYFYALADDGSMSELGSDNSYEWDGETLGTFDYTFDYYGFPVAASGTMTFEMAQ